MRYTLLIFLLLFPVVAVRAQQQPGTKEDGIIQAQVMALLEREYTLHYYDENINTPGDFIYSSQVATFIKKRPGKNFPDFWVQVTDHRRYDNPDIYFNFYVNPKTLEVFYLDTETNLIWTWDNWKRQAKSKRAKYSPLYYQNI